MREMKDSGIEWLGEIPAEWKRKKIPILYASSNEYPTEGYDRV